MTVNRSYHFPDGRSTKAPRIMTLCYFWGFTRWSLGKRECQADHLIANGKFSSRDSLKIYIFLEKSWVAKRFLRLPRQAFVCGILPRQLFFASWICCIETQKQPSCSWSSLHKHFLCVFGHHPKMLWCIMMFFFPLCWTLDLVLKPLSSVFVSENF